MLIIHQSFGPFWISQNYFILQGWQLCVYTAWNDQNPRAGFCCHAYRSHHGLHFSELVWAVNLDQPPGTRSSVTFEHCGRAWRTDGWPRKPLHHLGPRVVKSGGWSGREILFPVITGVQRKHHLGSSMIDSVHVPETRPRNEGILKNGGIFDL